MWPSDLEKEGWCLMGGMFQQQVSSCYCSAMVSGSQGRKYLKAQCTHSYHRLWHMLTPPKSTTVHFLSGGYSCGVRLFGGGGWFSGMMPCSYCQTVSCLFSGVKVWQWTLLVLGDRFSGMLPCSYSQMFAFFSGVEAWWWTLLVLGMGFMECRLALTPKHMPFSQVSRHDDRHCLFWGTDFL